MRPPLRVRLRGRQLNRLRDIFNQTRNARTRVHAQMVLLSHEGYSIEEIAQITYHSKEAVRLWLHRFLEEGCAGLNEWPRSGRPAGISPTIEQFLWYCAQRSPRDFGVARPSWTTALLAKLVKQQFKVAVTPECIRQHLERIDIVCRRPTWTVKHKARQKVGYAQKKGL